mmetsp:Transcript_56054/g.173803  ORF Transcript_56054/g.173803 Transcript_56054/m.173803 type:complete len:209 (-) Transcript_56054:105-731(-)
MKAFFINADLDVERRVGMLATCELLRLDCERVAPPALDDPEVQRCVREAELKPFECSLTLAHAGILATISGMTERAAIFEDDARVNARVPAEAARRLLSAIEDDFVMGGWCDPSCAHAYVVSPGGAARLLSRGFAAAGSPADCMFPHFKFGRTWADIELSGGKLLFPHHCPGGYEGDIGLFCQDRSSYHSNAYYLAEYLGALDSYCED